MDSPGRLFGKEVAIATPFAPRIILSQNLRTNLQTLANARPRHNRSHYALGLS